MNDGAEEKSVLAYFPSGDKAEEAAGELKGLGYQTVRVDRISHYGGGGGRYFSEIAGPVTGMTLFPTEGLFDGAGPLQDSAGAAGNGNGNDFGLAGGRAFLVTVITGEGDAGQVREVLDRYGGRV